MAIETKTVTAQVRDVKVWRLLFRSYCHSTKRAMQLPISNALC